LLQSKVDEMSVFNPSIHDNPTSFLKTLFAQPSDAMDIVNSSVSEMTELVPAVPVHFLPQSSGDFSTFGIITSEISVTAVKAIVVSIFG
jgi:hypothetical protein